MQADFMSTKKMRFYAVYLDDNSFFALFILNAKGLYAQYDMFKRHFFAKIL